MIRILTLLYRAKNHLYPHLSHSMHSDTARITRIMTKEMWIGAPILSTTHVLELEMNPVGARRTFHCS